MVRDLLGYRIRKPISKEMQEYMEKFYIYNNKIFQIIRISKHYKLDGGFWVDFTIQNIETKKIFSHSMSLKLFKEKKLFSLKPKLNITKDN